MTAREVYLAADPINAEIAKDMLAGHGIAAHVRHQHLWGATGELPANIYPSVWVDDAADYDAARVLIKALERGPVRRARPWDCPECGERLLGQFDRCWNCHTPRTAP